MFSFVPRGAKKSYHTGFSIQSLVVPLCILSDSPD